MTIQTETYFYEPTKGHGLPHDPFKAIVAPRPIGWISTRSRAGQVNLAPYSFFNAFSSNPPIIGFSSESYKDSVRNAEDSGDDLELHHVETLGVGCSVDLDLMRSQRRVGAQVMRHRLSVGPALFGAAPAEISGNGLRRFIEHVVAVRIHVAP